MEAIKPTFQELNCCMNEPHCIRNVCILAHVDHGKTTLCDLLLATNCLVSKNMAGSLRYLDDRPDEQERGITMKSSAVSLLNALRDDTSSTYRNILLNLIDTPGHIDFSSEVGAAVRVCDGAIILVDAVEGVCVQTRESISRAYEEHVKMILLINKLDRLILELHQDIDRMFQTIIQVIEDCNVIIAELYRYGFTNDKDIEDTGLLFSPTTGNVIFGSAVDGWAFTTMHMSRMVIKAIQNETVESLNEKMWNFDYWVDSKGLIKTGARDKQKENIFIQLCLRTVVHIYETLAVRMEKNKLPGILKTLNIAEPTRDMIVSNDPKAQIRRIMSFWKPLARTLLEQCLNIIPSPNKMEKEKIEYLQNYNFYVEDTYLKKCVDGFTPYFNAGHINAPTLCYVSKMFCVEKKHLIQKGPKLFLPTSRRISDPYRKMLNLSLSDKQETSMLGPGGEQRDVLTTEEIIKQISGQHAVIALTRIFTGSLKVGQEIYAISSDYLPNEKAIRADPEAFIASNKHVSKVVVKQLYMIFGRELTAVNQVPAGNFCGIAGIEDSVLRTATLSSKLDVVPIIEHPTALPVVKYAIEPINPKNLPILRFGLKLLVQSDSCVQVIMQETGEIVILTAGDVHLDKCLQDLLHNFAKVEFQVSRPMVSLRETISNTLISSTEEITVASTNLNLSLVAVALPAEIVKIISNNHDILKMIEEKQNYGLIDLIRKISENGNVGEKLQPKLQTFKSAVTTRTVAHLKRQLRTAFENHDTEWKSLKSNIWSVSKLPGCVNILINNSSDYEQNIFFETNVRDKRTLLAQCVLKAFHSFVKAGPICEEPLLNCAFIVNKFELKKDILPEEINPQMMSLEENGVTAAMKTAFEKGDQRLMEPMYTTSIRVNPTILGKVYTVINKRHGKVLEAVGMDEKEKTFLVQAVIPVLESEGFATEIRKTTSGQANPSLQFSHYEVIDGDPFFEPVQTDNDRDDEFETKLDSAMRANKLRKDVRRRKGLAVEDEVVVHAEKQRTLNKKK